MTLKTDKSPAELRLENGIAQLRHLVVTGSESTPALERVITLLEEGQQGMLDEIARVEAERDSAVTQHRQMVQQLEHRTLTLGAAVKRAEAAEAKLARFEDMARRVKAYQAARRRWDGLSLVVYMSDVKPAEDDLLALQTETHDGK